MCLVCLFLVSLAYPCLGSQRVFVWCTFLFVIFMVHLRLYLCLYSLLSSLKQTFRCECGPLRERKATLVVSLATLCHNLGILPTILIFITITSIIFIITIIFVILPSQDQCLGGLRCPANPGKNWLRCRNSWRKLSAERCICNLCLYLCLYLYSYLYL